MKMNKVIAILMVIMMALTMTVSAYGETMTEKLIKEYNIVERILPEKITSEELVADEDSHKHPNYVITIGGDQLIDVEVDHHPGFICAIGNGCKWVGSKITDGIQKIKGIFTKEDK